MNSIFGAKRIDLCGSRGDLRQQQVPARCHLSQLPAEVVHQIAKHCHDRDLLALTRSGSRFLRAASDEHLSLKAPSFAPGRGLSRQPGLEVLMDPRLEGPDGGKLFAYHWAMAAQGAGCLVPLQNHLLCGTAILDDYGNTVWSWSRKALPLTLFSCLLRHHLGSAEAFGNIGEAYSDFYVRCFLTETNIAHGIEYCLWARQLMDQSLPSTSAILYATFSPQELEDILSPR